MKIKISSNLTEITTEGNKTLEMEFSSVSAPERFINTSKNTYQQLDDTKGSIFYDQDNTTHNYHTSMETFSTSSFIENSNADLNNNRTENKFDDISQTSSTVLSNRDGDSAVNVAKRTENDGKSLEVEVSTINPDRLMALESIQDKFGMIKSKIDGDGVNIFGKGTSIQDSNPGEDKPKEALNALLREVNSFGFGTDSINKLANLKKKDEVTAEGLSKSMLMLDSWKRDRYKAFHTNDWKNKNNLNPEVNSTNSAMSDLRGELGKTTGGLGGLAATNTNGHAWATAGGQLADQFLGGAGIWNAVANISGDLGAGGSNFSDADWNTEVDELAVLNTVTKDTMYTSKPGVRFKAKRDVVQTIYHNDESVKVFPSKRYHPKGETFETNYGIEIENLRGHELNKSKLPIKEMFGPKETIYSIIKKRDAELYNDTDGGIDIYEWQKPSQLFDHFTASNLSTDQARLITFLKNKNTYNRTLGYIYIRPFYDYRPGMDRTDSGLGVMQIPFEFNPNISEGPMQANYQQETLLGRLGQFQIFTGTNLSTLNIELQYMSLAPDNLTDEEQKNLNKQFSTDAWQYYWTNNRIEAIEMKLRSLVLANYVDGSGYLIKPPLVEIHLTNEGESADTVGDLYKYPASTTHTDGGFGFSLDNNVGEKYLSYSRALGTQSRYKKYIVNSVQIDKINDASVLYPTLYGRVYNADYKTSMNPMYHLSMDKGGYSRRVGFKAQLQLTEVTENYLDLVPDFRAYYDAWSAKEQMADNVSDYVAYKTGTAQGTTIPSFDDYASVEDILAASAYTAVSNISTLDERLDALYKEYELLSILYAKANALVDRKPAYKIGEFNSKDNNFYFLKDKNGEIAASSSTEGNTNTVSNSNGIFRAVHKNVEISQIKATFGQESNNDIEENDELKNLFGDLKIAFEKVYSEGDVKTLRNNYYKDFANILEARSDGKVIISDSYYSVLDKSKLEAKYRYINLGTVDSLMNDINEIVDKMDEAITEHENAKPEITNPLTKIYLEDKRTLDTYIKKLKNNVEKYNGTLNKLKESKFDFTAAGIINDFPSYVTERGGETLILSNGSEILPVPVLFTKIMEIRNKEIEEAIKDKEDKIKAIKGFKSKNSEAMSFLKSLASGGDVSSTTKNTLSNETKLNKILEYIGYSGYKLYAYYDKENKLQNLCLKGATKKGYNTKCSDESNKEAEYATYSINGEAVFNFKNCIEYNQIGKLKELKPKDFSFDFAGTKLTLNDKVDKFESFFNDILLGPENEYHNKMIDFITKNKAILLGISDTENMQSIKVEKADSKDIVIPNYLLANKDIDTSTADGFNEFIKTKEETKNEKLYKSDDIKPGEDSVLKTLPIKYTISNSEITVVSFTYLLNKLLDGLKTAIDSMKDLFDSEKELINCDKNIEELNTLSQELDTKHMYKDLINEYIKGTFGEKLTELQSDLERLLTWVVDTGKLDNVINNLRDQIVSEKEKRAEFLKNLGEQITELTKLINGHIYKADTVFRKEYIKANLQTLFNENDAKGCEKESDYRNYVNNFFSNGSSSKGYINYAVDSKKAVEAESASSPSCFKKDGKYFLKAFYFTDKGIEKLGQKVGTGSPTTGISISEFGTIGKMVYNKSKSQELANKITRANNSSAVNNISKLKG